MDAATVNLALTLNEVSFIINVLGETKSSTGAFPLMQKLFLAAEAQKPADEPVATTE